MRFAQCFALAAVVLPSQAIAQSIVAEPAQRPLTAEAEAAYLKSSGSSNQETIKGFFYTRYLRNAWTYELRAEGLNESDRMTDLRTRERYFVLQKTSWNFTPKDYLFIKPQFEKDLQSVYDYQVMISAGYGHQFFKTDTLFWNVDIGAGSRISRIEANREVEDEAVGNLATRFEWQIRPGTRFTEVAAADIGEETTVVRTRTALVFSITDVLGLSLSYDTKRENSTPRLDDSLVAFGLNYRLK
ncbi:MAG: hypothetical protein K0S46_2143 [Moraxellaceae bacterium]|jgi:putative salt-induced outer membrane protein YdiY|nr:hypothetical protein [Moraxellaceae bacterium]